jgi:hypothetical protein
MAECPVNDRPLDSNVNKSLYLRRFTHGDVLWPAFGTVPLLIDPLNRGYYPRILIRGYIAGIESRPHPRFAEHGRVLCLFPDLTRRQLRLLVPSVLLTLAAKYMAHSAAETRRVRRHELTNRLYLQLS